MDKPFLMDQAPGHPGSPPNWCSGAKQMVGTTLGPARVWFTIGSGIINEVYYPRVDIPQLRDLGYFVADNKGFWVEVKRLESRVSLAESGVPAVTVIHRHARFTLTQRIVPEPNRDVLLIELTLDGEPDLSPYVLIAPRLGGTGFENRGEAGRYRGRRILWARQGPFGLALAAVDVRQADAFGAVSAGYSGTSDGWQDFRQNGRMRWRYQRAGPGNIALTGALHSSKVVLALGFATSREAAATLAVSALLQPFQLIWEQQIGQWRDWAQDCAGHCGAAVATELSGPTLDQLQTSAMVLRTHHDKTFRGAMVASLSIPWGESGAERPGYHLVWPRDLVECAGAQLALGAEVEAREVLRYLIATQAEDGCWYQNQWLGGKPHWTGVQLDQVAFPVLLAGTLADRNALDGIEVEDMVRRALGFIILHGPVSPQDRWEENSGVNTFTLAVCIAALVSGARFLPAAAEALAVVLADYWNARLEDWTAVTDTELARQYGVRGYYIRTAPPEALTDDRTLARVMPVKNRHRDPGLAAAEQLGVDFLQLVRFGLRRADDPLVVDTLKIVDDQLRVDLPQGPAWYRYNGDGYGEHTDGRAYDGTGRGRPWPLLTGERGHYELVRGGDARAYLAAMAAMAGPGGMLPEQVWDSAPIPALGLATGGPTGSAMPLAWAHAEYVKLAYSIAQGNPVDRPEPLWARYHGHRPTAHVWYWSPQAPIRHIPPTARLGFCLPSPVSIHWRADGAAENKVGTRESVLGVHIAELPQPTMRARQICFRFEGDMPDTATERCVIVTK